MAFVFLMGSREWLLDCLSGVRKVYSVYMFNLSDYFSYHLLSATVLCALPFAASFADEAKHQFLPLMITRAGIGRYLANKLIIVAISGFAVYALGIGVAAFIQCLVGSPIPHDPSIGENLLQYGYPMTSMWGPIYGAQGEHGVRLMCTYCLYFGLQGAIWAIAGLAVSAFWPNRYVALASPLAIYLIHYTISSLIPPPYNEFINFPINQYYQSFGSIGWLFTLGCAVIWSSLFSILFIWRARKRILEDGLR
ncbi:MAG: hypothetical protein ACOYJA_12455 [Christensenellales bacterium]